MLAVAKTGIHLAPRERTPLALLTRPGPFEGILQSPARVLVEPFRSIVQHDALHNIDHGVQIFERIERQPFVTSGHEAFRAAAILRRASAVAASTTGISLPSVQLQPVLDANLTASVDIQVILADEPRPLAQAQRRQRHVRRRGRHLQGAITPGMHAEVAEVDTLPPIATWITPCNSRNV